MDAVYTVNMGMRSHIDAMLCLGRGTTVYGKFSKQHINTKKMNFTEGELVAASDMSGQIL